MTRVNWLLAMVAVSTLGTACTDEPTSMSTGAGTLSLRLTTPYTDDGAVLFDVSGPPIDSAMSGNASLQLFTRRVGSTLVGAVVGGVANGAVVTLQVPDVGAAAGYTARVVEVADRQDALRASLTGYTLAVVPNVP